MGINITIADRFEEFRMMLRKCPSNKIVVHGMEAGIQKFL